MHQLELFEEGPQPIQRWLHVWDEAKRTKEKALAAKAQGGAGKPGRREEADKAACQRIRQLPSGKPVSRQDRSGTGRNGECAE